MLADYFQLITNYLFASSLLCLSFPFVYSSSRYVNNQSTEILSFSQRRRIGPEIMWLYKQRVRRAEPDCSNEAEKNAELQQAISSMIIGNDDRSYFTQTTQHRHRTKVTREKSALCEEDNGPDEIAPDTPIKDRALCAFHYIENFNSTRLPQTIPEVRCACSKPTNRMVLNRFPQIRCEPIYYNVPVIKFQGSCNDFEKTTERISLACVPVLSSQSSSKVLIETNEGEQADVPSK